MSMLTDFWAEIDSQLEQVRSATTVDEVLAACPPVPGTSVGAGFFAGSGGDDQLIDALGEGWKIVRIEADYYWVAQDCNGDFLAYTEGDLDKGDNPSCGSSSRDDDEQPRSESYCDLCEVNGHTFSSCSARDDDFGSEFE